MLTSSANAWDVGAEASVDAVYRGYRRNIERTDAIIAATTLGAAPAGWPDVFGTWRLAAAREVLLHVKRGDPRQ